MNFVTLTEDQTIFYHLSLKQNLDEKTTVYSTLVQLLKEARIAVSRDELTGRNKGKQVYTNWLGIVGYFIVLDQIGKCYKPKNQPLCNNSNAIKKALYHFTDLDKNEINAIAALRHCFVHDFSLINRNAKHPDNTYNFRIADEGYLPGRIVKTAKHPLDLDTELSEDNVTVINIIRLTELVEMIFHKVYDFYRINNLSVIIDGGADTIKEKYLIFTYKLD